MIFPKSPILERHANWVGLNWDDPPNWKTVISGKSWNVLKIIEYSKTKVVCKKEECHTLWAMSGEL